MSQDGSAIVPTGSASVSDSPAPLSLKGRCNCVPVVRLVSPDAQMTRYSSAAMVVLAGKVNGLPPSAIVQPPRSTVEPELLCNSIQSSKAPVLSANVVSLIARNSLITTSVVIASAVAGRTTAGTTIASSTNASQACAALRKKVTPGLSAQTRSKLGGLPAIVAGDPPNLLHRWRWGGLGGNVGYCFP